MRGLNPKRWRFPRYYPGWWLSNPGAGGGSGTVQTDGVTIQGDGSAGNKIAIKQVETDTTLTGAGTVASGLGVNGWGVPYVQKIIAVGANAVTAPNIALCALPLYAATKFSKIAIFIASCNATAGSDFGLYNAAGVLVANVGSHVLTTGAINSFNTVQGLLTISPGTYFFAFTTADTGVQIEVGGGADTTNLYINLAFSAGGGATLPASITPPALVASAGGFDFTMF